MTPSDERDLLIYLSCILGYIISSSSLLSRLHFINEGIENCILNWSHVETMLILLQVFFLQASSFADVLNVLVEGKCTVLVQDPSILLPVIYSQSVNK